MTIESEKKLEKKLANDVKKLGGWSVKLLSTYVKGLPDRLLLFNRGRLAFAEVKTTGKKATKIQSLIHKKLTDLGFTVVVLDSSEAINQFLKQYQN